MKAPLPVKFTSGNMVYQLIYIPGLSAEADPRYAVPPATSKMLAVTGGTKDVVIPGQGKRALSWGIMEQPSMPGSVQPSRRYLFLYFSKTGQAIPLNLLDPQQDMICYAMQPVSPAAADPIQALVDDLFGNTPQQQAKREDSSWATDMFSIPTPEQEPAPGSEEVAS